jgi:hypothetical protein
MSRVAPLRRFREEKRAAVAGAGYLGATGATAPAATFLVIGRRR